MTDPTLQTSGMLLVAFKNLTNLTDCYNGNWTGISLVPNPPTYGPANLPPPAWTLGNQYQEQPAVAYSFGAVLPTSWGNAAVGLTKVASITDMSAQTVVTGKQYSFTVDTPIDSFGVGVRLYWMISGVPGGSTVLPGFGLFNLSGAPKAWSYLTPPVFDGDWSLQLANPNYAEAVTLSVSYVPPRTMADGTVASRLAFSVAGGQLTFLTPSGVTDQPEADRSADAASVLDVLSPPDSYTSHSDPQPA